MTCRLATLLGLHMFLFACGALAQATKVDLFGGYQYSHPDGGPNLNGWNAALTGNVTRHFGVTGDFSGTYGGGGSIYTFAFGPTVSGGSAARPFAHALFGGARLAAGGLSTTAFVMMVGGGLDIGRRNLAFRVVQGDWMIFHENGFTDKNNVRVSTGIVLRF